VVIGDNPVMDRTVTKTSLHERGAADLAYWLSQPVQARLAAVEALRMQYMQTLPDAEQRLQRVCRVTSLKRG
jgi:hypothetical protein